MRSSRPGRAPGGGEAGRDRGGLEAERQREAGGGHAGSRRLCAPTSGEATAISPRGVSSVARMPERSNETSRAQISAPGTPVRHTVRPAARSSSASRRPCSSSTFTTATPSRGEELDEEPPLGLEVGLHVRVVVEVVAPQVGEGGGAEGEAGHPLLVEGVGGDLEDARRGRRRRTISASSACSSAASGVVCEAGSSRPGRRQLTVPTSPAGMPAARGAGLDEPGDGGLALRAGDAAEVEPVARAAVQVGARERERASRRRDAQHGRRGAIEVALGEDGHRAGARRGRGEGGAVGPGAGDGHEEGARFHLA